MKATENKTKKFLYSIEEFSQMDMPSYIIERAKEALLDYIGVTYAGAAFHADKIRTLLGFVEDGAGLAIGLGRNISVKDAAFLNGLNAHALDFDDGANEGIIHLGSPVFSVLMPLAKKYNISGSQLLHASVVGYEAAWTLAASIQPAHKLKGFHATGTCGMLGAVLGAACMLGFNGVETYRAFSAALCSATGTLKVLEDGSELKPYNVAKAALLAVVALQMAKAGYEVPADAMSGARGFLELATGDANTQVYLPKKDGIYAIMRTYIKPYAACRYCHPAIEAAIRLGEELDRNLNLIDSIEVKTYGLAVTNHDHTVIKGESSAKMSIPYGVAVGFRFGQAGIREYTHPAIIDIKTLLLADSVSVFEDEGMSKEFPTKTMAELSIKLFDGSMLTERVEHPIGEPENPLCRNAICQKFCEMVIFGGMGSMFADEVIEAVFDLENSLPRLFALMEETAI